MGYLPRFSGIEVADKEAVFSIVGSSQETSSSLDDEVERCGSLILCEQEP